MEGHSLCEIFCIILSPSNLCQINHWLPLSSESSGRIGYPFDDITR